MSLVDDLRGKIEAGRFELSRHAVDQSILRHIGLQEMREAVANGEVIEEYPEDKYWPSYLIYGRTTEGRPLHVQCSHPSRPLVKIVTLYEPDPARWIDFREETEMSPKQEEKLVERRVTYALEFEGKFHVIENVPARVNEETGEQFFSPSTVERLQTIILEHTEPSKVIETPVYEFVE